jgi:hypothetical protein
MVIWKLWSNGQNSNVELLDKFWADCRLMYFWSKWQAAGQMVSRVSNGLPLVKWWVNRLVVGRMVSRWSHRGQLVKWQATQPPLVKW